MIFKRMLGLISQNDSEKKLMESIHSFINSFKSITIFLGNHDLKEHNSHVCDHQRFSVYKEYWRKVPRNEILYLKDWHFHRDTQHDYSAYTTPSFFASDWLNEWWESRTASYNAVLMILCNPDLDIGPE